MVGYKFCEKFVAKAASENYSLEVFGEEPRPAYDRVHLSEYFTGTTADELSLAPLSWYEGNNIQLHCGQLITDVDREKKIVTTQKGQNHSYDKLVIATGSAPFVPKITGADKKGVFVYRTIEDLDAIIKHGKQVAQNGNKKAAVLGGGLLGLEAAKALQGLDLKANVVQFGPRLMEVQLDDGGADLLKSKIEDLGVTVLTSKNTLEIIDGDVCKHKMVFSDGTSLETDLILYSAGIRPRHEIAEACGLDIAPRGGVVINDNCETSDKDIYAIGECASWQGQTFGLVAPGYGMARAVVSQLAGGTDTFSGADMTELCQRATKAAIRESIACEEERKKLMTGEDEQMMDMDDPVP